MTVKKFFEIPVSCSLIFCSPPHEFNHLRFKDDIHLIRSDPQKSLNKIKPFLENIIRSREIIEKVLRRIKKKHTFKPRREKTFEVFDIINKQIFQGSKWLNVKYIIFKKNK